MSLIRWALIQRSSSEGPCVTTFRLQTRVVLTKCARGDRKSLPDPTAPPRGLTILTDFVSTSEESKLLAFLDQQQWRTDLARRTIHYGGTYCLMHLRTASSAEHELIEADIKTADAIPATLHWLIDRMVEHDLYQENARPEFCIINEYREVQGISAHVENFRFGEPVCALTLGSGDWIRFLLGSSAQMMGVSEVARPPKPSGRVGNWMYGYPV